MPATAWCAKQCHVHTQDPNRRTLGRSEAEHNTKNILFRGRPTGAVVKFAHSALAAWGSPGRSRVGIYAPLGKPCCGRCPAYKVEEDGLGCQLRANLPQKKEEDW